MHPLATFLVFLLLSVHQSSCAGARAPASNFSSCLASYGVSNFSLPTSPSYTTLLNSSIFNLRPTTIALPGSRDDLRRTVVCACDSSPAIRVHSGGRSYEGLSYTTENHVPFVVANLMNLNHVWVDHGSATTWAESGATLGELYYAVGAVERVLGILIWVGINRWFRGLHLDPVEGLVLYPAADNVLDAVLINPDAEILDRSTMGDDMFWAIRAGVLCTLGSSNSSRFLTTSPYSRSVELIAGLVHRWQSVGPDLPDEFYLSVYNSTGSSDGNVSASFQGQVLESKEHAFSVLNQSFPELGLSEADQYEMSWVGSTASFAGLGTNNWSSAEAVPRAKSSSGEAYFGENFDRLVRAKTLIDAGNVFNNAQSIPPLHY